VVKIHGGGGDDGKSWQEKQVKSTDEQGQKRIRTAGKLNIPNSWLKKKKESTS